MIYLGKQAVGISFPMKTDDNWKTTVFTVENDSLRADGLLNFIQNVIPPCAFAIGVVKRDYNNPPETNNVLIGFLWNGAMNNSTFMRYRNGEYNCITSNFISSYDCVMQSGDNIIVTYLEKDEEVTTNG